MVLPRAFFCRSGRAVCDSCLFERAVRSVVHGNLPGHKSRCNVLAGFYCVNAVGCYRNLAPGVETGFRRRLFACLSGIGTVVVFSLGHFTCDSRFKSILGLCPRKLHNVGNGRLHISWPAVDDDARRLGS